VEVSTFISSEVEKFLRRKLGDALKHAIIAVSFTDKGVDVEVEVDASVLVDDAYLQRVVDEAAELGICLADAVREKGWPLAREDVDKCWKR